MQILRFMNEVTQDESIYDRWEKLGFTYGILDSRIKMMTAESFERMAHYLMENDEYISELTKDKVLSKDDLEMVVFPIIRRFHTDGFGIGTVLCTNPELMCEEIVDFWEENKYFIETNNDLNIDKEAILCAHFVDKCNNINREINMSNRLNE